MGLRKQSKVKTEFSMASMTDLIFLLLIFFVITSTMVNPNAIKLTLPKGITQVPAQLPLEIAIDADKRVYIQNKETTYENFQKDLETAIAVRNDDKEITLSLSADKSVPMENLVKVLTVAQEMRLKLIIRTGKE